MDLKNQVHDVRVMDDDEFWGIVFFNNALEVEPPFFVVRVNKKSRVAEKRSFASVGEKLKYGFQEGE